MTMLVLERAFEPPRSRAEVIQAIGESGWCFEMHKVRWLGSILASSGRSMVCRFTAADAESIRLALRLARIDMKVLWPGTTHDVPEPRVANVLVERTFDEPVELEDLQAREDASQWCLDARDVKFVRTYFSRDRKRMLCLYSAPDAEAVRSAQREAGMPFDEVWSFIELDAADLQPQSA
jgi:hypothetical protein